MRALSMLTAAVVVMGLTACGAGGGGGPGDLNLGGPTSAPVTTKTAPATTTSGAPADGNALVARARVARLAVYAAPDAGQPTRVLANPWTPKGAPRERIPQVLLVKTRRADGWVEVLLPDTPRPTAGWVRGFDVKITNVTYRVRVVLSRHRITIFKGDRHVFQSPIRTTEAQEAQVEPGGFYIRRVEPARAMATTASPYTYRFIARLVRRIPLGTPVEIVR
jgi:hypothetical protein